MTDVLIDFQFSAMAKHAHSGDNLTAFLGGFYGLYLNLFTFVLQVLLTSFVVSRFGIGGILQIMPISLGLGSIGTLLAPGVWTTGILRLIEASSRYSFNRTGMELLYLPLPAALRNRTKVFVDIFVDRMARGLGGLLLVFLAPIADLHPRWVSLLVIVFAVGWSVLANRARYEYVLTVRKKLQTRRLDLEHARVTVGEPVMMQLLEKTALEGNARQARYALSLLGETKEYPLEPLLEKVAGRSLDEVRAAAYDLARASGFPGLLDHARREIDSGSAAVAAAARYLVTLSPLPPEKVRECLNESACEVAEGAVLALGTKPDLAKEILTGEWFSQAIANPDPRRRRLAALAIAAHGDQSTPGLHRLLVDPDVGVVEAASRAAGKLRLRDRRGAAGHCAALQNAIRTD
jgi:AAA family ATP:ADP antiporter